VSDQAEIARRWRKNNPERAALNAQQMAARTAAHRKLSRLYPDDFERLFRAECRRRGIPRHMPRM
jgi:hypothetical protein